MTGPTSRPSPFSFSSAPRPDEQNPARVSRLPVARIDRHLVSATTRRRLPPPSTSCAPETLPDPRPLLLLEHHRCRSLPAPPADLIPGFPALPSRVILVGHHAG
ncbi:hypothetical protein ACQJBY_003547 [Aegilops geniculata]